LELISYFGEHIPNRPYALDMLTSAFLGVLGHDEFELPLPLPTRIKLDILLRWLGKMVGRKGESDDD
jgi:hypothetical protein